MWYTEKFKRSIILHMDFLSAFVIKFFSSSKSVPLIYPNMVSNTMGKKPTHVDQDTI